MTEEKKRILKMLEDGKVTADEAERLIEAIEAQKEEPEGRRKARWMRIKVQENGKAKVNINLPISLMKALLKITGKLNINFGGKSLQNTLKEQGINIESVEDLNKIIDEFGGEGPYKLVDVEDGGDKVEILIE